jgi:glycosyltransferase involved in cell wall biosynthesis
MSVIIFVRNSARTIECTIESVVSQNCGGIELIVLDGGSTDGTAEVIRRYESQIAYWRSSPDGGPTNAINEGISRSSGDVICILPGDDWLEPGSIARVLRAFAMDPELDVLSCGARYVKFDVDGQMHVDQAFTSPEVLDFNLRNVLGNPLTGSRFMRRRVYERFGGHSQDFKFGDFDFLIRVCLGKLKSAVLPELTYTYRRHAGSTTLGGNPVMVLLMAQERVMLASKYLKRDDLEDTERKLFLAMHGRSSLRYAWMSLARGRFRITMQVIVEAIGRNPLWPLQAAGWLLQRRSDRPSAVYAI